MLQALDTASLSPAAKRFKATHGGSADGAPLAGKLVVDTQTDTPLC